MTIQFDYSKDTSGFFANNPAAKTVLQQAGQIIGSQLNDSLSAIVPGSGNTWTASLLNPSNVNTQLTIDNLTIPANTIVIYAGGATNLGGGLAVGSSGGWGAGGTPDWLNLVATRGQAGALSASPTDFGPWGGSISFNANSNWSFAGTGGTPGASQFDFLTLALQQLTEVLGVGSAPSWTSRVDAPGHLFNGPHAKASFGGPVPLDPGSNFFFATGLKSFGVEPLMDGVVSPGLRRGLSSLDWAALSDVGWNPDHLAFTTQPPNSVTVGTGFGLAVTAQDPNGHADTVFKGLVTLAIGNNPSGGALSGTQSVTATNGVAAFGGLSLDHVGNGYTLQASALGTALATTTAFNVIASGAATQLVVTTQPPASVTAGGSFTLIVSAEDGGGTVDPNFNGSVTLALANNPGGATLGGTLTVSAKNGLATFSGLTLNKSGASYTLQATGTGLSAGTTSGFNVTAAAATKLVVTAQPPANVLAGNGFSVAVAAQDPFGNIDPTFKSAVALSLVSNPGGASLGGAVTVSAVNGVATFPGLILANAGTGYTIKATGTGLSPATTSPFNVAVRLASTITIKFDYTFDTSGFFTNNAAAKTVLDQVGQILGSQLHDSLAAIVPDPASGNTWSAVFANPSDLSTPVSINNLVVPANTLIVYVGDMDLSGQSDLGIGGAGGASSSGSNAWNTLVSTRGETGASATPPTDFGPWGGSVTFDNSSSSNWSFVGANGVPPAGKNDFLSVALHEIGHVLGIGVSSSWSTFVNASNHTFTGPHAVASNGGPVPLFNGADLPGEPVGDNHWAQSDLSADANGNLVTPVMAPTYDGGRSSFTSLDWAGLDDIGWDTDQFVVTSQPPANVTTGAGFGLTVSALDPNGHVDKTFNGTVTLALGNNPGSATLGGTLTATAVQGVATFSGLTINQGGTGYTILATDSQDTSVTTTGPINVIGASATQLLVTTQPPANVTSNVGFGFTVTAANAAGVVDPSFNGSVTLALANNPNGATLGGTLTVSATNGVATFSGITLDKVGTGLTLQVSSSGLTSATSSAFNVVAAAAKQLVVTAQPPASVTAGTGFSVTVTAKDPSGNVASSFNGSVTLALANNPAGATLGGTLTVSASNGVATFSGITLDKVGTGLTLQVSSSGLTSATTSAFNVVAAAAKQLVVTAQPPASVTAGAGFSITVTAKDPSGNVATSFNGSVTLALANNPVGATLGGTLTVSASNGVATFSGITLDKVGTGLTLQVSSSGLTSATTSGVNVTAAAAKQLVVTAQPPASVTSGAGFSVTVTASDPSGNVDGSFNGSVTLALANNPGGAALGGTLTVTAANGIATFSSLTLDKVGTGLTLQVSSTGLTSATTSAFNVIAAAAKQLVVTAQPPASVTSGAGFSVTVTAKDSSGNVATSFNGSVTLALANNPNGATLGGTLTVSATNGVATFTGLTLDKIGTGLTLQVSSTGLTSATTSAVSVTAALAKQLVVTTQPPANVTSGAGFSMTVTAKDPLGNVDVSFNGSVTLALANNPGGATLGGTLTVSASNGVATFSGLSLDKVGTGLTLQVSSTGLTSATTSAFNVIAAAAKQLVVTAQPPASVTSGTGFSVTIAAKDPSGNVATSFNGSVTLAFANNPGAATLGGTLTVSASNGVATFSGLTLDKVGTGLTLQVSSSGLTSATTSAFNVVAASAKQLVVTAQPPASVTAGAGFSVKVTAKDPSGNVATSFNGSVTLALANNPSGATLGGTLTVSAANGIATFSGLSLDKVGTGLTLQVSSTGLTSATTTAINVTVAAAKQLVVTTQPPATVTSGAGFSLSVTAKDASGNVAPSFKGSVTLALANNPGGATLGGTLTVTAANGVATFSGLTLNKVGTGVTLQISTSGLTSATTSAFNVIAAPAKQLVVTTKPPASVTAGAGFSMTVTAKDPSGNTATSFKGSVTLALANNPSGATLGGTLTVTAANGIATFSGLTLDKVGTGLTLVVSSSGVTSATTTAINVTPASAKRLVVTIQPPATVTAGMGFSLTVTAKDASGNVDTSFKGSVALALANNPSGAKLGGMLTVTAANGIATFSALTLDNVGTGLTLVVSSTGLTSATTGPFNVVAASAKRLVVTTQPPTKVTAGTAFSLKVTVKDALGNVATSFKGAVKLALANNPGGAALGGTLTVTAANGIATFSGLTLNKIGTGVTLLATSGGLTSSTSNAFNVIPATVKQLVVTTQPPSSVTAGAKFGLKVTAKDAFGNAVPSFTGKVTLALGKNPGGSALGGTLTVTAVGGVATFSGLTLGKAGVGYTLKASSGSLTLATTAAFNVTAATATKLVVTTAPPSPVKVGAKFGIKLSARDGFGNLATAFHGPVTLSLASKPAGAVLGGTLTVNASGGVATFSNLTLNKPSTSYAIKATAANLTSVTTAAFKVNAGASATGAVRPHSVGSGGHGPKVVPHHAPVRPRLTITPHRPAGPLGLRRHP